MKDHKGKTTGLMMEGSSAYMSALEANKKLMNNPDIKMGGDIIDETAQDSAVKMGHKDSPATFTGMSGGSALHQEGDPDLSEHANILFSGKKLTKEQLEKIKKDFGVVEKKVINDDTTKTKKPKVKTTITTTSTKK
ncbi:MAG: hypothetical protein ACWA5P_13150 [bacterium]